MRQNLGWVFKQAINEAIRKERMSPGAAIVLSENASTHEPSVNIPVQDLASLKTRLQAETDGASGADYIGVTPIAETGDADTVQEILEAIITRLKAIADSSSGADLIGATAIASLGTAATVQAILEALAVMTTQGDLSYQGSAGPARLGIGTAGQVLAVNTGATAPEWVDPPAAENGLPSGGTTNQLAAKNSADDYDVKWVDAPDAANGLPSGGTAGQLLAKVDSDDYNCEWVDPSSGGITESRIGLLLPVTPSAGTTARESVWMRVVCLKDCTITSVKAYLYALTGNIKLRVARVSNLTGNDTIAAEIYTGAYVSPAARPCVHNFSGLSISLTKDNVYAIIFESESGTTLQYDASNIRAVLGQGSFLPASTDLGGYTTRGSSTLTAYSSTIIPVMIAYK